MKISIFTGKSTHGLVSITLSVLLAAASAPAEQPATTSNSVPTVVPAVTPAVTSTPVTTTGGLAGRIPVFTGASTLDNSVLYQTTTGIGIGRYPNATLDVGGNSTYRGIMGLSRSNEATATVGAKSFPITIQSSVYNSSLKVNLQPYFQLQTEPSGNNTATTGATFNFLYFSGVGSAPSETGLYFNGNGTIHFATGQTFPITTGATGPAGPQGPVGPAGPSGPTGPSGPASPQYWTSTTLLAPFVSEIAQYGTVMGASDGLSDSDFYSRYRRALIFPNACTLADLKVNFGFESVSSPFDMQTAVMVNNTTAAACTTGYDSSTGVGFTCTSSATYSVPAGAQVVLQFSHTGTNPSNLYPMVTFTCK